MSLQNQQANYQFKSLCFLHALLLLFLMITLVPYLSICYLILKSYVLTSSCSLNVLKVFCSTLLTNAHALTVVHYKVDLIIYQLNIFILVLSIKKFKIKILMVISMVHLILNLFVIFSFCFWMMNVYFQINYS